MIDQSWIKKPNNLENKLNLQLVFCFQLSQILILSSRKWNFLSIYLFDGERLQVIFIAEKNLIRCNCSVMDA